MTRWTCGDRFADGVLTAIARRQHHRSEHKHRIKLFTISGLSIPAPLGGKQRQIIVDVDPTRLSAKDFSQLDVVGFSVSAEPRRTNVLRKAAACGRAPSPILRRPHSLRALRAAMDPC